MECSAISLIFTLCARFKRAKTHSYKRSCSDSTLRFWYIALTPTDRSIDRSKKLKKLKKTNYNDKIIIQITSIGQDPGLVKYFSIVNREVKRFIDDNTWLFKVIMTMRWRAYCYFLLRFFSFHFCCWCCLSNISTNNWNEKLCYKVKTPLIPTDSRFFFFSCAQYQSNVCKSLVFFVVWNSDTQREIRRIRRKEKWGLRWVVIFSQ